MYKDGVDDDNKPMLTEQEIEQEFAKEYNVDLSKELKRLNNNTPVQSQIIATEAGADDVENDSVLDGVWDLSQQALQGATFGFADEIEARLRAVAKGTEYKDEIEDVRAEIEAFREKNPGLAFTAEMAGAFLIPGFATTKLIQMAPKLGQFAKGEKLFNAMKRSIIGAGAGAVDGGLYGAGVAKEGERIEGAKEGAFWGSILGAGLGPTVGWFTDAIAGKLGSKVGQKGDNMVDIDGNEVIASATPAMQKDAQDLMITSARIDDVAGLQNLQNNLDEMIDTMPGPLQKMTFAQLYPDGGMGQGLAELLAKSPGKGMATSRKIYDDIADGLPEQGRKLIEKEVGPRIANVEEFKKFLVSRATKKARPFYDKAEKKLVDVPDLIAHVQRLMGPKKTATNAGPDTVGKVLREVLATTRLDLPRKLAKKGIDAPNWGKAGPYNNSPIFHWDLLKQELGSVIKEAKKSSKMSGTNLSDLEGLYSDIAETLRKKSPDYDTASKIHVKKHKYTEFFDQGLDAHTDKSITPEFMNKQLQKLRGKDGSASTSDEMMYRLGYAFGMYKKILNKPSKTGKDVKANLGLFAEDQLDKLRIIFKDEKVADKFLEKIHILSKSSSTANKMRYGSPTYPLQVMNELVDGMDQPGVLESTIKMIKNWGGSTKLDDMMESPKQKRLDAATVMMNKQGPEEMQKVLNDLQARQLEQIGRQSTTYGASYPIGATGATIPLSSGEDRNWMGDNQNQTPVNGIIDGLIDLPSKMYQSLL